MKHVEYRTISRFPGYRFGDDGSVWSSWQPAGMGHGMKIGQNWRRLKPGVSRGYHFVRLSHGDATTEMVMVHIGVAEAFWGPKPDPSMDCCHNDGNRGNCALSNLRYDTKKGNCADKHKHGTMYGGEQHHDAKLTVSDVRDIRQSYGKEPVTSIAARHGVSTRNAWSVIRRETWKHV